MHSSLSCLKIFFCGCCVHLLWARARARARARVGLEVWAKGIGSDDVCGPLATDPSLLFAISA